MPSEMNTARQVIHIYQKYYIDRNYEQIDLFRLLKNRYLISKVVYPGSYVHISPSFIFSDVVYIDADRKAKQFFRQSEQVKDYICECKEYQEEPRFAF